MRERENLRHHATSLLPHAMIALIGISAAGCASAPHRGVPIALAATTSVRTETTNDYRIEVVNRNWQDVHVYAVKGTLKHPLGAVGGNASRTLRLPAAFVGRLGGLQLAARPIGRSELHYSEVIDLAPGQTLGWSLEPNLKLSFAWIR